MACTSTVTTTDGKLTVIHRSDWSGTAKLICRPEFVDVDHEPFEVELPGSLLKAMFDQFARADVIDEAIRLLEGMY